MPQRQRTIDPLADTQRFSIDVLADTQRFACPVFAATVEPAAQRWSDEGERDAERECAQLKGAGEAGTCVRLPFALALAGTAAFASFVSLL